MNTILDWLGIHMKIRSTLMLGHGNDALEEKRHKDDRAKQLLRYRLLIVETKTEHCYMVSSWSSDLPFS